MPLARNSVSTMCGATRVIRVDSRGDDLSIQKPRVTNPDIDASANAKWLYFKSKYMLWLKLQKNQ